MTDIVSRLRKANGNLTSNEQSALDSEAARTILQLRENVTDLLGQRNAQREKDAQIAEAMTNNEPDGYYGQACREVAAAIRAGEANVLPTPWLD